MTDTSSAFSITDELIFLIRWRPIAETMRILNERLSNLSSSCREKLLHYAARTGKPKIIQFFIDLGCPVDCLGEGNQTPLMTAVQVGRKETVRLLLKAGADINLINTKGESALYLALHSHPIDFKVVEAVILKAKVEAPTIEALIQKLIAAECCFSYFVILRDADVLRDLLRRGYNINSRDPWGRAALHLAARINEIGLVKVLIDHGADVNALVGDFSVLYYAASQANLNMIKLLIEHGASVLANFYYIDRSPLFVCLVAGKSRDDELVRECAEFLLQCGIFPDEPVYFISELRDCYNDLLQSSRLNCLVAHQAMLDMLGIAPCENNEHISVKFQKLREYYDKCRNMLNTKVNKTISLLDLVGGYTAYEMRIRVRDQNFISQIERFYDSMPKLTELHSYYASTLTKRIKKAAHTVELENKAIPVICQIFDSNCNQLHVFARRVVRYLSQLDLEHLCQL